MSPVSGPELQQQPPALEQGQPCLQSYPGTESETITPSQRLGVPPLGLSWANSGAEFSEETEVQAWEQGSGSSPVCPAGGAHELCNQQTLGTGGPSVCVLRTGLWDQRGQ